jgi:hypothetical protein
MINVTLTGLDQLKATLGGADKQVRFAASRALNRLAQLGIQDVKAEMRDSFDRPTPWTLNSVRQYGLATRDKPETGIDFKATGRTGGIDPELYLRWQVYGGERRIKRFERALRAAGALPDGYVTVPGQGAKLDAYGNMSQGQIVQILSYFQAFLETGFKANATPATKARMARGTRSKFGFAYFVGRPGGRGQLGVYQRVRIAAGVNELLPILIFVRSARYQRRLALDDAIQGTVQRHAQPIFQEELAKALATAR